MAPDKRSFLSINVTHVRLHLSAWYDGGCEIDHFMIQYKPRLQEDWVTLSDNILREQVSVVIRDLLPGTWHDLLVTAKNQVGVTDIKYRFATLNVDGTTVQPLPQDLLNAQQSNGGDPSGDENQLRGGDDRGRSKNSLDLLWRGWHWSWRQLFNDPLVFIPVLCTLFVLASILCFALFIFVVRWRQKRLLTHLVVASTASNNCQASSLHHAHHQHQQPPSAGGGIGVGGGHHMNIHGSPLTTSTSQHNSNTSSPKNGIGSSRNHVNNYHHQMHINASSNQGHLYDTMHTINQQHYHNQQLTLRQQQQQQSNNGQQLLACPDQQQIAMGDDAHQHQQLVNSSSCQINAQQQQQQQYNQQQQQQAVNLTNDPYGTLRNHNHAHLHLIHANHQSPTHNNSNTVGYYATGNHQQQQQQQFPMAQYDNSNNTNNVELTNGDNGLIVKQALTANQSAFDEIASSLSTSYDRMAQRLLLNGYATLKGNNNNNGGINGKRSTLEAALMNKSHQLTMMNQQQTDDISLNAYSVNNNSAPKYASSSTSAGTSNTASTTTTTSVDASIITNNSQLNDQSDNNIITNTTDSSSGYNSFVINSNSTTNHRLFNGMTANTDQTNQQQHQHQLHQMATGDGTLNELLHYNNNHNQETTDNNNQSLDGDQNHFLSEAAFDSLAGQLLPTNDDCQLSSIIGMPIKKQQQKESLIKLDNNKQFGSNADKTTDSDNKAVNESVTKDNNNLQQTTIDDIAGSGVQRNIHNWYNAAATEGATKGGSVLLRLTPANQCLANNLVDFSTKTEATDRDHIYEVPYKYKNDQLKQQQLQQQQQQQQHMTISFDRSKLQSVCHYN